MIPRELAKKIRYIQIYTNRAVNNVLAGEYESVFKGRGMEFDEVREYMPGDEIRTIDWNVTAKTGKPHVKRYVEERELTVMFLVDLSASGSFGSVAKSKNEIAAELCALLAFSAIKNNDKVGLIVFTDTIEMYIPPKKGQIHALRLIRELLFFKPKQVNTSIQIGLDYLGRISHKKSVVFLISDFLEGGYEQAMRITAKRHDLIAISVADRRELVMPNAGLIELEDAETGEVVVIDTGSAKVRRDYQRRNADESNELSRQFSSMGVDQIEVRTDQDYLKNIIRFFTTREGRL